MRGFFTFLRAILWVFTGALADLGDTVLVWVGLKYWPATGRARWQSDRPKPDPEATAWQRRINQGDQRDEEP